jgi:3-deoxy-D-manno-octulosonic acid kinase
MTPADQTILEEPGLFIVYDEALAGDPGARLFAPEAWGDNATPHSEGRGTVWFVEQGSSRWVLKAFQRGGFVGRFIKARYFFLGNRRARMFREFQLLSRLHRLGLPVPRPVAACVSRTGLLSYSGSLITQRLDNVRSLASCVSRGELPEDHQFREIGRIIRRFHDNHVFHSDLNAGNVLLDENAVYLIDFDRSRIRPNGFGGDWRRANLQRLRRSLDKLSVQGVVDLERPWRLLRGGYEEAEAR